MSQDDRDEEVQVKDMGLQLRDDLRVLVDTMVVNANNVTLNLENVIRSKGEKTRLSYADLARRSFDVSVGHIVSKVNAFKNHTRDVYVETLKPYVPEKKKPVKKAATKKGDEPQKKSKGRDKSPARTPPRSPPRSPPRLTIQEDALPVQEEVIPTASAPSTPPQADYNTESDVPMAPVKDADKEAEFAEAYTQPATPTYE